MAALPCSRFAAEASVCVLTAGVLLTALWRTDEHQTGLALAFALLVPAAFTAELAGGVALSGLYMQRRAGSSGLALGALALPCAFAGLAVKQQREAGGAAPPPAALSLLTCTAAAAAAIGTLLWQLRGRSGAQGTNGSLKQAGTGRKQPGSSGASRSSSAWRLSAALALAAAALPATAAAAAQAPGGTVALATAAAAVAGLHALLALLPGVFTIGEALVAAEGAALLGYAALHQVLGTRQTPAVGPHRPFVILLSAGSLLAAAALFPLLLLRQQAATRNGMQRQTSSSVSAESNRAAPLVALAAAAVALLAVAAAAPAALWALHLSTSSRRRCLLCGWWAGALAAALPIQRWLLGRMRGILVRKGYHVLAVCLFLPALLLEPQLLGVALAAALCALLAVEAARLSGLPGVAAPIHSFMASFIDARDSGPILVTHFTLLLGMAAPVWLTNALDAGGGTAGQQQQLWLAAYAGIIILGFGDTAASAVGSLVGRWPLCRGSKKTVEGTAAAVAVTLAAWWLLAAATAALGAPAAGSGLAPLLAGGGGSWAALAGATALSCLLEGVTTQLDNIFMPLHYFALLCLL